MHVNESALCLEPSGAPWEGCQMWPIKIEEALLNRSFRETTDEYLAQVYPIHMAIYSGHTYTEELFTVYLKF